MASNDLKRVGLVFTQEGAVDFKKTLQDINLEMNKNYNQFKLTQAQWDKSTTSTQKLRAEQEYLKNAYEVQQDKVSTLRMQLSDLENAEEKNVTAIKKKRNELTSAEVKLESYNKRIKEIEGQLHNTGKKIEEFGEKTINVGNKIEGAGKKLSVFSAATTAALVASAKSAIDFEDAFTGVEKTVDGTDEQMSKLRQGIRDMAKEIPSTTTEISAVAEAAGQLGIKTDDILSFTRVMIDLGNSTNLSAEEAATSLAKFANVTKMSSKDYDRLGSTIVALGNNFATTEADIVQMATRLAATGELAGLSQSQILSLATAMSSVGIEAEAGGSAMSKLLKKIQVATETGGKDLKQFAKIAGMSSKDFKKAFQQDAVKALSAFIKGLNNTEKNGKSAIGILEDMGLKEVRLSNTILSLANASDLLNESVELGSKAWNDNTALTNEANKRYDTLKSKLTVAMNKLKDIAITVGEKLMPAISKVVDKIGEWANGFSKLSDEQVQMIVNIGLVIAAIGPLLTIIGKVITVGGSALKAVGTFTQAIGVAKGTITSTSSAVNGLATVFSAITSPIGIACIGIGASIGLIAGAVEAAEKGTKEAFSNMGNSATDFVKGIDNANSHLDSFNSTLFASAEEQQKLKQEMDEVQQGITTICKRASDERRGYTQEEITQLEEYFTKLRELKNREIEIQQKISEAITIQAQQNAQTFQGSLEEYKIQSQEWIKTAEEQKDKEVAIINDRTTQEIALLQQRYGDKATLDNEEYKREYDAIIENKDKAIQEANDEVSKVNSAYAEGYLNRSRESDSFYNTLKETLEKQEKLEDNHKEEIRKIKDGELWYVTDRAAAVRSENDKFAYNRRLTWEKMYDDMSEEQEKELGTWLSMVAQTEMYGGEIDDETKEMVDGILKSYDKMPSETRETMKNAMTPMLDEMNKKQPSLFSKATSIANGILSRLKKSFDIHSPSRKTREIFKNVMKRNGKRN